MNFITGEIREDCFVAPGLVWPLAEPVRPGTATLGVRPEFVRATAKGRLRAEVVRDEYQGACRYIHLQAECGRVVMRVADRERVAVGTAVGLDFARVLLFDPTSGKRLRDTLTDSCNSFLQPSFDRPGIEVDVVY